MQTEKRDKDPGEHLMHASRNALQYGEGSLATNIPSDARDILNIAAGDDLTIDVFSDRIEIRCEDTPQPHEPLTSTTRSVVQHGDWSIVVCIPAPARRIHDIKTATLLHITICRDRLIIKKHPAHADQDGGVV